MDANSTSVFIALPPSVFQLETAIVCHFPMERFFTRRADPPTTAWPQRHDEEEDFLASCGTMRQPSWRWSGGRVEKPTVDEHYTQALCRHGMSLFGERSAPTDGAEAVAAVEPAKSKRAYHQPSRDLPLWVVDYALLRHLQRWDNRMTAAWLPDVFQPWLSTRTLRRWLDDNKKEGREPRDACDVLIPIL